MDVLALRSEEGGPKGRMKGQSCEDVDIDARFEEALEQAPAPQLNSFPKEERK
jgi:hypothetical protein